MYSAVYSMIKITLSIIIVINHYNRYQNHIIISKPSKNKQWKLIREQKFEGTEHRKPIFFGGRGAEKFFGLNKFLVGQF